MPSVEKELPYNEQLMAFAGLENPEVERLVALFHNFCREQNIVPGPENDQRTIRAIRQFLLERKPEIKASFTGSLLGQPGCFAYATRCCLLAGSCGIETRLARSEKLSSVLHILVLRKDGRPFDLTNPTPKSAVPLEWKSIQRYLYFVQPVVSSIDAIRKKNALRAQKSPEVTAVE